MFLCLGVMFPVAVHADVRINEIAWMGTANSHTDEWIELYNAGGSAIDLEGWRIVARDDSPTISLEGTIDAGETFLLERTDDTVVEPSADVIYTGSLANSGEVLDLIDANGSTVFTVDGSDEWNAIGGNNETKDTAQFSDGAWQTAAPTPDAANTTAPATEEPSADDTEANNDSDVQEPEDIFGDTTIHVDAGENRTVTAGAEATFTGRALGFADEPLTEAEFTWSFGDGTRIDGREATHTFAYPGRYVVVLSVASGEQMGRDVITVSARPAHLSIADIGDAYIEIHNDAHRTIDISRWFLSDGTNTFQFPEITRILGNEAIRFHTRTTGLASTTGTAALLYPNGKTVATYTPAQRVTEQSAKQSPSETKPVQSSQNVQSRTLRTSPATQPDTEAQKESTERATRTDSAAAPVLATSTTDSPDLSVWLLALAGVIGIGIVGVAAPTFRTKNTKESPSSEYTIIEMDAERDTRTGTETATDTKTENNTNR